MLILTLIILPIGIILTLASDQRTGGRRRRRRRRRR